MTKKEFKTQIAIHRYGHRRDRPLAIYFDWKVVPRQGGHFSVGYKYALISYEGCPLNVLINAAYAWMVKGEKPPLYISHPKNDDLWWSCKTREAYTDAERFKVSMSE